MLTLPIPLLLSCLTRLLSLGLLTVGIGLLYRPARQWVRYDRIRRKAHRDDLVFSNGNSDERRAVAADDWWKDPSDSKAFDLRSRSAAIYIHGAFCDSVLFSRWPRMSLR